MKVSQHEEMKRKQQSMKQDGGKKQTRLPRATLARPDKVLLTVTPHRACGAGQRTDMPIIACGRRFSLLLPLQTSAYHPI